MASEAPVTRPAHASLWRRILKWLGIAVVAIVILLLLIVLGINTDPGRRFVADQIGNYTTESGLNIKVGRIDGSLYGRMVLRDVRVNDPKGAFATSPELVVDWRPFEYIHKHIDVRELHAGLVTLARNPQLKPTPPSPKNSPILPDIDLDVNALSVDRLVLEAPVAGARHIAKIAGNAHIADRRAQLLVDANALTGPGVAGGDALHLKLDAVPDDDKLDIDVKLRAPTGGVVAGLASLKAPLTLSVDGAGSWKAWNGRLSSTLGAGSLADLTLTARDGTFDIKGLTRPGLYLTGPVERLTAPGLSVDIHTAVAERRADSRFSLRSSALAVAGDGLIDLGQSTFSNFKVGADLLTPGAIAPNLKGRNLHAEVALNGAFRTPTVDYKVLGDLVQFGSMGVEGVYAEGRATVDSKRILLPIHAKARRVIGLNAAVGGLVTNVAIDGDVAINGTQVLSDNLRLRSDKIDATAVVAANLSTGRYAGALKGRINNYRVEGFGIVSLNTDARLVTEPNGGFGIRGHVVARTSALFNQGAKNFLGGNAIVSANVGYDPNGLVTFDSLKLVAPKFRVTRGEGRYSLNNGAVAVSADAYSAQYGPVTARVTGSVANPAVVIHAARPGVGIGLVNVNARIVGRGGAYAVVASGGTKYGPFTADVVVRPGRELAVDIHRVLFAGVTFTGRVVQTAAGPFAGGLQFVGSGLSGQVRLAAQGRYQRADVNARANQFHVPGMAGLSIGRALVSASVVLYPQAPQVVADAQVADLRYGPTVVSAGRVKVNYVGGRGTAQALLTGSNGAPFRLAANAQLELNRYLVALQGQANGINFRTGNPALIQAAGGAYRLNPTQIVFDHGSARVAGSYGKGITAQLRLDSLDLAIANAFVPNIGLGGQATGSVDYAQASSAATPTANVRLTVANFTRTSLAASSEPVDIVFAGTLNQGGAEGRALVNRGGTTVGRMVADLRPIPAGGGSFASRLMAAPLSGGIRYNGPAGVLFSLAALPNQQVAGAIAIGADFSGRVSSPQVTGLIRADDLTYTNETYGTQFTNLRIGARFNNDRLVVEQFSAKAGDGTVTAQGSVGLAAAQGFPIDLTATLNKAQLARSDALGATASGQIHITNNLQGGLIQGTINVENARYQIVREGSAQVPELTGVRRKSDLNKPVAPANAAPKPNGVFKLDLNLRAPNQLFVTGMGLDSEWQLDMHVGGTSAAPEVTGNIKIVRGDYTFSGKRFDVTRGTVTFHGAALSDPDIDLQASTTVNGITAVIAVSGTGQHPQITFTSTPVLPQDEVLSRLLFGTDPSNLSATEAIQLASALNSLRSTGGGLNPLGKLRSGLGIDRLRILGSDQTSGRGQALAAGKYITRNIYVEIITDARGYTATQLEISLTKALQLLSSAGSFGGSNASLRYQREY